MEINEFIRLVAGTIAMCQLLRTEKGRYTAAVLITIFLMLT